MKVKVYEKVSDDPCPTWKMVREVETDDMAGVVVQARASAPGKAMRFKGDEGVAVGLDENDEPDYEQLKASIAAHRPLHVYEVDDGEQSWYSAESKEEALEMYLEPLRRADGTIAEDQFGCLIDEIEVTELSQDTMLPVRDEDSGNTVTKTAREWAAEGKGLVATTAW